MPRWVPVDVRTPLAQAAADDRDVRLPEDFVTEFDTRNGTEREAFFRWLADPLTCFTRPFTDDVAGEREISKADESSDPVERELDGLGLPGVDPNWKVFTVLRNHHRRLNPRINMLRATVSYEEETVYVDVYKQLGEDDET